MPDIPFPITAKNLTQALQQMQRLADDLYQERIAGALLGDVFEIGADDILSLKLSDTGGLQKVAAEVAIKPDPTGGLQTGAAGIAAKLKAAGGLTKSADGLYFNVTAKGDLIGGTASGAVAVLPIGSAGKVLSVGGAGATGLEWTAAVLNTLFDANTILKADTDDTPVALTVGEQTLVGRITAGVITALSSAQVRTLLGLATTDSPVFVTAKLSGLADGKIPYHVDDTTGFADGPVKTDVDDAVTKKHAQQHAITSTSDHTSTATSGKMLKADANGLPIDATNTDAQVSAAVTASHAAVTLANPNHGLGLTGQEMTLGTPSTCTNATVNAVTTTSHTHAVTGFATGAGSASGANTQDVTLAVSADVLMGLTGQAISLDTQNANLIFAGPGTGVAAAPTFRTMVAADVPDELITYAKMQHVSATDKVLGRSTAGAGDIEEIACTAAGRALLDDAAASNQRATLGLTGAILGDTTDGRVLRLIDLRILNATDAAHVKCSTASIWNGDVNAEQDNIGKDGVTTGVWSLSADGSALTLLNTGISGDCVAVLSTDVWENDSTAVFFVRGLKNANGFTLYFTNSSGAAVDTTALVDTGGIYLYIFYVTSA